MEEISLREFAERLKVPMSDIHAAYRSGAFVSCRQTPAGGLRFEWPGSKAEFDAFSLTKSTEPKSPEPRAPKSSVPTMRNEELAAGIALKKSRAAKEMYGAKKAQVDFETHAQSAEIIQRKHMAVMLKAEADAARAQMELDREARLLAPAEELEDLFAAMVADARDRAMNIPAVMKAKFPAMDQEELDFLGEEIAGMLSALAAKGTDA